MGRQMNTVALLPMKAHSERVPGKNFRTLGEKPLYRWILETLLSVEEIELVVINTDARKLLEESGLRDSQRVLIRDRPEELCGDFVSMNKVLENDLQNVVAETYLMTHTTNPFVKPLTVERALQTYREQLSGGSNDSLFSVNRIQSRFYKADGKPVNHDPNQLIRTQDLEPWYEENSCLYLFSHDSFSKTNARIGTSPYLFEMQQLESIDIDDKEDWQLASLIASAKSVH